VPVITRSLRAVGTAGQPFSYQIVATNNPISYGASGLPAGLSVDAVTGLISGTATTMGNSNVGICASNAIGTGSATISITMRGSYAAWQGLWFPPGQLGDPTISGETAAPAGDGIPNLMKYALNLDPMASGIGGLPVVSGTAFGPYNYLTLSYTQVVLATDITYIPEVSSDLQNWYSGAGYILPIRVMPNGNGATETVVVLDLTPEGNGMPQFIRLRVTGP